MYRISAIITIFSLSVLVAGSPSDLFAQNYSNSANPYNAEISNDIYALPQNGYGQNHQSAYGQPDQQRQHIQPEIGRDGRIYSSYGNSQPATNPALGQQQQYGQEQVVATGRRGSGFADPLNPSYPSQQQVSDFGQNLQGNYPDQQQVAQHFAQPQQQEYPQPQQYAPAGQMVQVSPRDGSPEEIAAATNDYFVPYNPNVASNRVPAPQVPQYVPTVKEKKPANNDLVNNELFSPRTPTPERLFSSELSVPEKFSTSNNLVKKAGSFYSAVGEIIYVQGKVTDSFGLPIHDAIVEIWQTNSAGKYQTLLEPGSDLIDRNFSMSGRTKTDNLGNYYFITIMPGHYLKRAPHINMNVYHEKFGKIETEMYFQGHPLNEKDYQYLSYNQDEQKALTAKVRLVSVYDPKSTKICTFDIVMDGVHRYKSFGGSI